ncbi:hypothetical protein [Streptomyces sp. NPDC037389]|uniref:hypothetical protein n=1 Tax=Streptomyces sp. NPDC037389 TaxID=3155369 RepID=UPI0033DE7097
MIHVSETLITHSVEDFLTAEEIDRLNKLVDAHLDEVPWTVARAARYEELFPVPEVQDVLAEAARRALPAVRRVAPSLAGCTSWGMYQGAVGDRVPPHLHGVDRHAFDGPRRVARLAVVVRAADRGGDFFVDTTSSASVWCGGEAEPQETDFAVGMHFTRRPGPGHGVQEADWLAGTPRARWTVVAPVGTAVVYGTQLVHGVTPVVRGTLRKFVTSLTEPADHR